MAQYGLTKELIESGDLRMMMALEPEGTENKNMFEWARTLDDLIQVKPGKRPALSYDTAALQRYDALQPRFLTSSILIRNGVATSGPLGAYRRGTCVLAGSAADLNIGFLDKVRELGFPIIGLGNVCCTYKKLDFWIGNRDVLSYTPYAIDSQVITAFVRDSYLKDGLWDSVSLKQSGITADRSVNTYGYTLESRPITDWLAADNCRLCDFEVDSTFTVGLSLAIALGFQNILLTGIKFGGSLEEFFCFDEVPYRDSVQRKAAPYTRLRTQFATIYRACAHYGIRIGAVEDTPLPIPRFTIDYLDKVLGNIVMLSRRSAPVKTRITLPPERKRRYLELVKQHQSAMVTPGVLLDTVDAWVKAVPERFGTPAVTKALVDIQDAAKRGGCTGCAKNKLGQPIYAAFEAGVKAEDPVLMKAWKELLPNHYILKLGLLKGTVVSDMIFRDDHVEEKALWEEVKL
jgi:hypothetical protein